MNQLQSVKDRNYCCTERKTAVRPEKEAAQNTARGYPSRMMCTGSLHQGYRRDFSRPSLPRNDVDHPFFRREHVWTLGGCGGSISILGPFRFLKTWGLECFSPAEHSSPPPHPKTNFGCGCLRALYMIDLKELLFRNV